MWCSVSEIFASPAASGAPSTALHTVASAHAMWRAISRICGTNAFAGSVTGASIRFTQFGQLADDSVRAHRVALWQPGAAHIDLDTVDALARRLRTVPLEIVADHPRVGGRDAEHVERPLVDARIGFTESDLA